eukprot:TRINITY_DN527_c0_g1_i2.p2 TRINITY_DN527_c0_g1~~TRINITY_DN527_c0_g1_i2.p2  ORF type:complete len:248 (+),score=93.96 TRINITY_DN527_c0_g1_i2:110-853(+)
MRAAAAVALAALCCPAAANKVPVTVIIESYCPCSGAWQYDFLTNIAPKVGDLVELKRSFDGSAKGSQHCCNPSATGPHTRLPVLPNGSHMVTCFHGMAECVADRLQRCVQALYPEWRQWLNYSVCAMGSCAGRKEATGCSEQFKMGQAANLALEQQCAQQLGMDWAAIDKCWTGAQGVALMQQDADFDDAVQETYGMQGLPVVYVGKDNVMTSKFWDCASHSDKYQAHLIGAICNATTASPKPAVCA